MAFAAAIRSPSRTSPGRDACKKLCRGPWRESDRPGKREPQLTDAAIGAFVFPYAAVRIRQCRFRGWVYAYRQEVGPNMQGARGGRFRGRRSPMDHSGGPGPIFTW